VDQQTLIAEEKPRFHRATARALRLDSQGKGHDAEAQP